MAIERNMRRGEWLGLAALAGLAGCFVAMSWRRWPDPLVDFGRELYVPWRLSQGAVLYRDVEDIYGPLSQYLNAGLFRLFGPGLMVLVAANLAVFAGILAALYALFRRAWGAGAALAAAAVLVSVFGFSQFLGIGNYNYAAPYSHEATHGMLVCLLLALVLARWVDEPTLRRSALAGLLLGLTAVLKPEFILAGAGVTAAALALRGGQLKRLGFRAIAAWALGAALPTAAFAGYFATRAPGWAALRMACRAWLFVSSGAGFTNLPLQAVFLGTDHPGQNLAAQAAATALAAALIAAMAGTAILADRTPRPWLRGTIGGLLVAGTLALACFAIDWISIGRCLLGLVLIYLVWMIGSNVARASSPCILEHGPPAHELTTHGQDAHATSNQRPVRILIAALAAALMARMALNGRIYHYGFFQAALAGALIPAVLVGELPGRLRAGPRGRRLFTAAVLLLLAAGAGRLAGRSLAMLRAKTYAVGAGADRFYTLPPQALGTGDVVKVVSGWLAKNAPGQTLVVLPEGEMINYLARMRSPIAPYAFFAAATSGGREARIVADLQAHPPDWIAIVSRDIRDNGVRFYGESDGEGQRILAWVADHYDPVMAVGGDPLNPDQCGGAVLRRR